MRAGIKVSSLTEFMYNVRWVPNGIVMLAQCTPDCEAHLARRKVRVIAELFAKDEFVDWGIIQDSELHRVLIANPAGDTTTVNDHQLIRGSTMQLPLHSWQLPEPCLITRKNNYHKRYMYYPQSGEIWSDTECVGNFDRLHASRADEQKFAGLMDNCSITTTLNRLDRSKYMVCDTTDFSERFFEKRNELWVVRKAREEKARLRKLAEMNK